MLKHKYFPTTSILDARLGSNTSYMERSNWGAKLIILSGLIWRVGNGRDIKIWEDKWTPMSLDIAAPIGCESWTVDNLIYAHTRT